MMKVFTGSIIMVMVLAGALNTIDLKFQNTTYVYDGPYYKQFFHPYLQTIIMFMSEMLALPIFFLLRKFKRGQFKERQKKAEQQGLDLHMNRLFLFIPSSCDLIASTLLFMSLNFISASAYQMLRGGCIITTFICSIFLLKIKIKRHHVSGSGLAFIGIVTVGLVNTFYSSSQGKDDGIGLELMGYILIFASLFFQGFQFTVEQKLMGKYYLEPIEIVGYEGLFGFCTSTLMVIILCYIPCPFGVDACVYTHQGQPFFQGWTVFLTQLSQNIFLYFLIAFSVIVALFFNVSGVSITKYINALARAIADVSKTVLVWLIGIIITVSFGPTYQNLKWQKLQPVVIIFQIIGFILIIFGNLVYNSMINIPFLGSNDKNQDLILKQEKEVQNDG